MLIDARPRGLAQLVGLATAAMALASCTGPGARPAAVAPSPSAAAEVPLPNFNSRLGSNRLAAEAAVLLGRRLYGQGQYWEVYVRTTPATLTGSYNPADPAASAPAAATVTQTDVVIATESASAIKAFGAGGQNHERAVLAELDALLRQAFPSMTVDTVKVFYGETFQHGAAVFNGGTLKDYTVRQLG